MTVYLRQFCKKKLVYTYIHVYAYTLICMVLANHTQNTISVEENSANKLYIRRIYMVLANPTQNANSVECYFLAGCNLFQ